MMIARAPGCRVSTTCLIPVEAQLVDERGYRVPVSGLRLHQLVEILPVHPVGQGASDHHQRLQLIGCTGQKEWVVPQRCGRPRERRGKSRKGGGRRVGEEKQQPGLFRKIGQTEGRHFMTKCSATLG